MSALPLSVPSPLPSPLSNPASRETIFTIASLQKGQSGRIERLGEAASKDQAATVLRLLELGFVPGERVSMVAKSFPGGHPVAVRLGNTTFALRRHEADLIHVAADAV